MKYVVERSILISRDISAVKPHLLDFSHWKAWSPWSVIEPDHKGDVSGNLGQVGSVMTWDGEVIGSGNITLSAMQDRRFDYDLAFIAPWKSEAKCSFLLAEKEGGTEVTWRMDAALPFYLFFMAGMMKAMIGMDYDRGLLMLKSVVETGAVGADTSAAGLVDFEGFAYVGIARTCHLDDMPQKMAKDFKRLGQACGDAPVTPAHYLGVYDKVKLGKQLFSFTSAVAGDKTDSLIDLPCMSDLVAGEIKSQKMFEIKHRGSYQYLGNAWAMGNMLLRAKKLKQNGAPFEYYHNDPDNTPEHELSTSIYFPVKV